MGWLVRWDGAAGIRKTTLAVQWEHRVQDRLPDGTLQVSLRGHELGDPATPGEVLEGFLWALGVAAGRIPGARRGYPAPVRHCRRGG
ncbi:hypothetical protein [Amycolatopsis aidingensis]|uniref:hypothetical protein n=1 Tax=Amycolatopsis aidingensis TaxID=2842453 RepID=UPI001C0C4BF2|nr:hypothetical protein [Amycolatopsis aidingensis]